MGWEEQVIGVESGNNDHHEPVRDLHDVSTFPFLRKLRDYLCAEQVIVLLQGVDVDTGRKTDVCENEKTRSESVSVS